MDAQAPAVVAVVVTRDPGPWLEESLAALARQDYPELSVLVLVAGGSTDPTARVAGVFPDAFVRRLPESGFGAAANEAIGMVEGASFFLFCHDDVVPRRNAVALMVEESVRSNAGIVTPKFVRWDDPRILLHVGMSADKTGAMVERLSAGEIDHGQHDNVRDVFVAPEGCTLVRADLFVELGGFDPVIAAMAADLDLSWRVQVAGARVVVCPDAAVRHLEAVAGGVRPTLGADGSVLPSDEALLRRYELRTVLKCYGAFHLLRVLPQIIVLGLGEMAVALAARHRSRARSVWEAWRWNLGHRAELRQARRRVQRSRQVHDSAIRRQQRSGSARLSAYFSNIAHLGFDVTHRQMTALAGTVAAEGETEAQGPELTGSVGGAFSEDADFDELDDLGRRSRRPGRPRILASRRSRLTAMVMIAILLALGSRDLLNGRLPLVGQFVPLLSWSGTWHQFFSGWQPAGVGTTAPASGAFAALGVIGTVLLGGMGLVQKVLVLGCLPLGAWGVSRLVRPLVSRRAGLVAAISYLGLPLAYDALARARVDGLVAFAATPWLLARLARTGGLSPFGSAAKDHTERSTRRLQLLSLGVILAVSMAFAPAMVIVAVLCAIGLACNVLVGGERGSGRRLVGAAAAAIVVALGLSAPWVVGTAFAGSRAAGVLGLPISTRPLSWVSLVRFHVGPVGGSPLSWLLLAAALFPLLVGTGPRFAWAARLWTVAVLAWALALVVERGWSGSFAPSVDVLLAPAAVAIAACVGLGVSAFETDLAGHRFGWRQAATAVMVAAVAVGVVPVVAEVGSGRWGAAPSGFEIPLSYLSVAANEGPFRVLWLGDPRTLPLGGWSAGPGLAYATSEDGLPTALDLFAPASPGPAATLAAALTLAQHGDTVHLGRLLAPAAVRYVVVLDTISPSVPGVQTSTAYPPPPGLIDSLDAQIDLRQIPGGEGFTVFENTAALPERAERGPSHPPLPKRMVTPTVRDVANWRGILAGPAGALGATGPVVAGTVFSSAAPAGHFQLVVQGRPAAWQPAFGWASQYRAQSGTAELRFHGNPIVPLAVLAQFVLWLVAASFLVDSRFSIRRRFRRRRGVERRHPARRARGRHRAPPQESAASSRGPSEVPS